MPTSDEMKAAGVDDDQPPNANTPVSPLATEAMPTVENPLRQATEARFRSMIREEWDARVLSRATAKMDELIKAAEEANAGQDAVTQNSALQRKRLNEQRVPKVKETIEKGRDRLTDAIVSVSLTMGQEEAMSRLRIGCEVVSICMDAQLTELFGTTHNNNTGEHAVQSE